MHGERKFRIFQFSKWMKCRIYANTLNKKKDDAVSKGLQRSFLSSLPSLTLDCDMVGPKPKISGCRNSLSCTEADMICSLSSPVASLSHRNY